MAIETDAGTLIYAGCIFLTQIALFAECRHVAPTDMSPVSVEDAHTKSERYIRGRITAMKRHTDIEIDGIVARMRTTRRDYVGPCHGFAAAGSVREWNVSPLYIAFHGFGTDFERSVFLRCLKYACSPRVLHSSFMDGNGFEGIMVLHPHSHHAIPDDIELLFDLFKMSLGSTDLGSYMSLSMIACIERIDTGSRVYGNWTCIRSQGVRSCYTALKRDRDVRRQRERVRTETGLDFTTGNMTALYHMRNNVLIEVTQHRNLLLHVSAMLDTLAIIDGDTTNVSAQYQFIRNVQQIIHEGTRLAQAPPNPLMPANIVGIIDLTM